ncbi:MAG: OmpA family protein [Elusimicrobia bacterium]|nr:OmpA family protein [Candidatus Liberimonas magnetica]
MKLPEIKKTSEQEDDQPWLISYADMVTLLLAFFIVMVSMSTLDKNKFEMMTEYFSKKDRMTLKQLELKIKDFIVHENMQVQIDAKLTANGVEVNFKDKLLFDVGKADVKPQAFDVLSKISALLSTGDIARRKIVVQGHTDSLPIKSDVYPSNWELSSARAAKVVKFFIAHSLDSRRFESVGYADTKPLIQETEKSKGHPENRRVVVVISPDSFLVEEMRKEISVSDLKKNPAAVQQTK